MNKNVMSSIHYGIIIRTNISVVIAALMATPAAFSAEEYKLGTVVVTANRTAQTVDETLAPVTVIDREEIERSQVVTIAELLNQSAPSVQVSSNGGPGSMSTVYIRGTKTAQSLILLDGQKINTAGSGSAPLEYLDPSQIERIEIVRGPRSTVYGADAIGGVINIITRKGSGTPRLILKVAGGSRRTDEYTGQINGEIDSTRFHLGGRFYETQGYDRTLTEYGMDDDDDAYRVKSFSGSYSTEVNNSLTTGVNILHSEGKSEYDVNSTWSSQGYPESFFEVSNVNVFAASVINQNWDSRLEAGFQRDHQNDKGPSPSHTTNKRYSLSWINNVVWKQSHLLTVGVDYSDDEIEGTGTYLKTERYNRGIFAQNLSTFDDNDLQIGGRYDDNEAFGGQLTGNIAWGFTISDEVRLVASYGTSYRAPTFTDMYSITSYTAANPNLDPEHSKNIELALEGKVSANSHWSVNVYQNDMDDMLNSAERPDGLWQTENIDKARIRGIEFELGTQFLGWEMCTNASYIDPESRSGTDKGKKLQYRAQQLVALDVGKRFSDWSIGGAFKAQGKTSVNTSNTEKLPGFGTVDLRASTKVMINVIAQLKIVNLFDRKYQPVKDYRGEPHGAFVTLTWSPEL
ncbi:MAG: TonB-dependent receptor domain-containing protein [Endozoicomonas sp.]